MPLHDPSPLTTAHAHGTPVLRLDGAGFSAVVDPSSPQGAAGRDPAPPLDPAVARCRSYVAGHAVHAIQMKLAARTEGVPHLLLDVEGRDLLVRTPQEEVVRWRVHDPTPLRAMLLLDGPSTVHLHGHGLLMAGHTPLYPCRDLEAWVPCRPGPAG